MTDSVALAQIAKRLEWTDPQVAQALREIAISVARIEWFADEIVRDCAEEEHAQHIREQHLRDAVERDLAIDRAANCVRMERGVMRVGGGCSRLFKETKQ